MSHPYRTIVLNTLIVVLLTSCTTSQAFRLIVNVLNPNGMPVQGASVTLDTQGVEERKLDLEYGSPLNKTTDVTGQLVHDFSVSGYPNTPRPWYLKVSKEGFEPVVIDIRPVNELGPSQEAIELTHKVELRPKAPPSQ